jgi:methyl-accepting chemotaxis protein
MSKTPSLRLALPLIPVALTGLSAFIAYPVIPALTVSSLAFAASLAVAVAFYRAERHCARVRKDLEGPVAKAATRLGRGISTFASGDLRIQIRHPDATPESPEGKAIAELLATDINDFNSSTAVPSKRICFTGANSYQEGRTAGERIVGILGGKGSVACAIPAFAQVNHVLRMKGCLDYLSNYPDIVWEGTFESGGTRDGAVTTTQAILAKFPSLSLLYVTDGHTPVAVEKTLRECAKRPVKLVAYDAMPDNMALLKEGRIECLIEQNSFAQAYNALIHLFNACEASWRPVSPKLFMPPLVITKENHRTYWDDDKDCRVLMDEERTQLAVPEQRKSQRRYRFALILPLSTGFFEGLTRGGEAAKRLLEEINVEVEIVDLFRDWDDFGRASLFNPAIESFIERKFDGIALTVNDPAIVETINRAAESGLAVTTLNTEPFSFRELVLNMIENVEILAESSHDLAAAAEESSRSAVQIGGAITGIKEDIGEQKNRIQANDDELAALNQMIGDMVSAIGKYGTLVGKMSSQSRDGSRASDETYVDTQKLKGAIDGIGNELGEFRERMKEVESFAATIEQLAESTNVLAINASIQAARAGTAGKSFSVVAGEVRTLAENSRHTAEAIKGVVDEVKKNMDAIISISKTGAAQVSANLDRALDTKNAFDDIVSTLQEANSSMDRIDTSINGIRSSGESVKKNMDVIESMSNTTKNRLDEITVSVSEMSLQSEHLSQTANDLRAMAMNQSIVFSQVSVKEAAKIRN